MSENKRHDDFFYYFFFNASLGWRNISIVRRGCSRWKIKIIMLLKETSRGLAQARLNPKGDLTQTRYERVYYFYFESPLLKTQSDTFLKVKNY